MSTTILDAALALARNGVNVLPVKQDGSKSPAAGALRSAGSWKEYQARPVTPEEVTTWFGAGNHALGIITGAISGNLEMAEIEGRAAHRIPEIQQLAYDSGFGALWEKVCNGWLERSPSGGMHWFYRLDETPAGNTRLARRPATLEELAENPREKWKVLTETRGEGGFVVVAPSGGTTHESGRPWEILAGGPDTIPTLTPEEHEQLHALLASINEEPPAPEPVRRAPSTPAAGGLFGAVSPGDDFEERTDWADILVPAGWRFAFQDGAGVRYWTRPGKSFGISATTGKDPERDRLFVFTSASDFDQETPYTKFGAYAHLNYGGDHSRAASALRKGGYGKDPEISAGGSTWNPNSQTSPFAAPATTQAAPAAGPVAPGDWTTTGAAPAPEQPAESTATAAEGQGAESKPVRRATMAYTDDGNATLLIAEYGRELRYNPDRGRWLHWNGSVWEWQPGNGGAARELAKDVVRQMDVEGNDAARQWKKKSLSASAISNMLLQAQTDPMITVNADELDANGWELNTPAGIIDLRTAELRPPNPESLHTKVTAVSPDFDSRSELFETFLTDTFQGDTDLQQYVQRLAGYSAVGVVREHILPFGLGKGGNGKGVLFETMVSVLGDYATSAPPGFLMKTGFQSHPTDLARLHGARLVINSEVNQGDKFDEAKIKALAGGDSITARFMRADNFTFKPTHQIWLMGNYQPAVEAGGDSFWRRLRLIPFTHKVPEEKKIEGLQDIFSGEHGPRVLAWIARGAADYYKHGLQDPESVTRATNAYAHEVDTVARFLEDEATVEEDPQFVNMITTSCNQVINAYERWCRNEGATPLKGKAFSNALADHGIRSGREVPKTVHGQRQYAGITLNASTMYSPADGDIPEELTGSPFSKQPKAW